MDSSCIVIVGGGAGGLELACKLGRRLGPERVLLVDRELFHIWKPSLHEVASGTLDIHQEGLSYQMLAHDCGFQFVYGAMLSLDAERRVIKIAAIVDEQGEQILPERELAYGSLVIAVGSTANHFGVPGAVENTVSLNDPSDAERFRLRMLKLLALADLRKSTQPEAGLDIVIIGAGATGVELAAELREAGAVHSHYGYKRIRPNEDIRITLLEGAARILAPLQENVSEAAAKILSARHVKVVTNCRVTRVDARQVLAADGQIFPADLCVWAAGIQAPAFLSKLGLATTRSGLLEVDGALAVKGATDIYALGDCAHCLQADGKPVPPRAQSAHQQADYLYQALLRAERGQLSRARPYIYTDHGSLVSLGTRSSVGSLMGNLFRSSNWFIEGWLARTMYVSLHLMHHQAVLGTMRTGLLALSRFLHKRATPLVKLH